MARYQFEDESDTDDWLDQGTRLMNLVVRGFGFILMIVGLWIGLSVISQAWALYQQPQNIERFVRAVEQGSNLDKALSTVGRGGDSTAAEQSTDDLLDDQHATPGNLSATDPGQQFRLSYFVAWLIALLLLMLIGRLAIAAVKTGGELALYDMQIKRFARTLVRERSGPVRQ